MADYVSVHQLTLQSVACAPIRSRTGSVIGALYLETRLRPAQSFSDQVPLFVAFADQVAIAIETARLISENERRARELARANEELTAAHAKLEERSVTARRSSPPRGAICARPAPSSEAISRVRGAGRDERGHAAASLMCLSTA